MPKSNSKFAVHQIMAILLVFFSVFMSVLVSRTVFERLPHLEDEVAYLYQAKIFARGDLVVETPHPRRAYWQPFVVDYSPTGNRFGKYTPGWPALLSIGVNLGQTWVINAFFAGLTVALVYRLGREIFNPDVGVIAAALVVFSPMAMLLNASLMGHTAALCFTTLFMYAYWRMGKGRQAQRWGTLAGIALGMVVVSRPLTALGIALPFVMWSGARLLTVARLQRRGDSTPFTASSFYQTQFWTTFKPLLALGVSTLIIGSAIPIFNYATTGNPTYNLYTLVWEYDRIGFGECCGRHGHTLQKGLNHARWDLSLTAADLFGWQFDPITPELQEHLKLENDYWPPVGLSWILLPFGLLVGVTSWTQKTKTKTKLRRIAGSIQPPNTSLCSPLPQGEGSGVRANRCRALSTGLWVVIGAAWVLWPFAVEVKFISDQSYRWLWWMWLGVSAFWLFVPLGYALLTKQPQTFTWTWLLATVPLALIGVHLMYWIGSQRYSTRYYFEALTALALISALPVAWLARRWKRWPIYMALSIVLNYSLYIYSTPRITTLYRFNFVGRHIIENVEERREGETPVLVIVNGPASGEDRVRWRAMGSLMPLTSPYLDSDIVVAWDYQDEGVREAIMERFPDRFVIEMDAQGNDVSFRGG